MHWCPSARYSAAMFLLGAGTFRKKGEEGGRSKDGAVIRELVLLFGKDGGEGGGGALGGRFRWDQY